MKQQRAIFFIDGSNFYHGLKRANLLPIENYKRISEKLAEQNGHQWLKTRFYIGKLKQEGNKNLYGEQRKFLQRLKSQDRRINYFLGRLNKQLAKGAAQKLEKWLKNLPNNPNVANMPPAAINELKQMAQEEKFHWQEKMVDVMLASDMVSMAHKNEFDIAYLLSADGDYVPAVKTVRETGRQVFIASAISGYALTQAANKFIFLNKDFFAELKEA